VGRHRRRPRRGAPGADGLDTTRHHLRTLRRYRPHLLSEPEEKLLTEKALTGRDAWTRLFSELTSAIRVELPTPTRACRSTSPSAASCRPIATCRRTTAEAVNAALEPGLRTRASVFNTLLLDKAVDDRLRSFPSWLASRNLANEASDESVEALLEAVRSNYDLPRRWYRLKAELLGLERLADYDRMASVADEERPSSGPRPPISSSPPSTSSRRCSATWPSASSTSTGSTRPVRPNKRGGAFCAYTTPSVHPFVMLNYTSRRRDVLVLAHELGHGLHAALAIPRGPLEQHTPLTVSETASVFGETLVFQRLLDAADSPRSRLALLAENIEGSIATVFRQTAMNGFEALVHTARREEGELSVDRFGELWHQSQAEMLGDAVEITDGYRMWWSYVPHFIGTPGYVYAYAYGQLLALSVYRRYLEEGEELRAALLELLGAGGSRSPEELAAIAGLDLEDPTFWAQGLDLVRDQLELAEAAAAEVRAGG
jgi:oligoendopeptidase F